MVPGLERFLLMPGAFPGGLATSDETGDVESAYGFRGELPVDNEDLIITTWWPEQEVVGSQITVHDGLRSARNFLC